VIAPKQGVLNQLRVMAHGAISSECQKQVPQLAWSHPCMQCIINQEQRQARQQVK